MIWLEVIGLFTFVGIVLWSLCDDIFHWLHGGLLDRECIGCQRHFVIPGCPVHDTERRKTEPRAVDREAVQTTRGAEESFIG